MQNFVDSLLISVLSSSFSSEIFWFSGGEILGSAESICLDFGCLLVAVLTVMTIEKIIAATITMNRMG